VLRVLRQEPASCLQLLVPLLLWHLLLPMVLVHRLLRRLLLQLLRSWRLQLPRP